MLQINQDRIDSAGFYPPAMEEVVFNHGYDKNGTPKQFKMTGTFAPANQILGIARYGRGSIPALSSQKEMREPTLEIAMIKGMSTI